MTPEKPTYSTTRTWMRWSFILAWGENFLLVAAALLGSAGMREAALSLAPVIIPSTFVLVAALMGIHRFSGSLDFAASRAGSAPAYPPNYYSPRDQPPGEGNNE